jgi:integrase
MAQVDLSQEFVNSIECAQGRAKEDFTDLNTKGLVLETRQSGGKTYYLRYTNARGKQRMYRLGDATVLTLVQARKKCRTEINNVAMGQDPGAEKTALRAVPTFAAFIEEQYLPYAKAHKRSWKTDVSLLNNHLLPRFGKCYLDEIDRVAIVKMHSERRAAGAAPGSANRLLIMVRFIFNLALKWDVAGVKENPTKNVPLFADDNKRERFLSAEEARRLYESVCRSDNPMLKYIVPMLILTGARKREVLDAKWEDFDFERRLWRIPTTKLGKPRHVPLSDGVMSLLTTMPRHPKSAWVFANPKTGKAYVSFFASWDTARTKAGLSDVRVHDLRHSFASLLINSGRTLYEVQKLLGHTQISTTQRYAHLSRETLLDASNAATQAVGSVMGVLPSRVVDVPLIQA